MSKGIAELYSMLSGESIVDAYKRMLAEHPGSVRVLLFHLELNTNHSFVMCSVSTSKTSAAQPV